MLVTTTDEIFGRTVVEYIGIVRGIRVGKPLNMVKDPEESSEVVRAEAVSRMMACAGQLGADAIVGMRYDTAATPSGLTEVLAYGTAVKLGKLADLAMVDRPS